MDDTKIQEVLLKYLDEMTIAHSIDSLALTLKKMGRNIESMLKMQGYDKENIVYLIPLSNKSYSLITLMYANLNGINPKNINSTFNITNENTEKAKVILDDLSASGTSEGKNCLDVRINYKIGKTPIIYAPVVLCSQAEDYSTRPATSYPSGYCFDKYTFDMAKTTRLAKSLTNNYIRTNTSALEEELKDHIEKNYKYLNYDDCKVLEKILFAGYDDNGLCILFPYMIPDNDSDIAGLILRNALMVDNYSTNKALGFLCSRRNINRKAYDDFEKIENKLEEIYYAKKSQE